MSTLATARLVRKLKRVHGLTSRDVIDLYKAGGKPGLWVLARQEVKR